MHLSGHGNVKTFLPQLSGWFKRKSWSDWRDSLFLRSFEGHFPFCSQRTIGKVYQKCYKTRTINQPNLLLSQGNLLDISRYWGGRKNVSSVTLYILEKIILDKCYKKQGSFENICRNS